MKRPHNTALRRAGLMRLALSAVLACAGLATAWPVAARWLAAPAARPAVPVPLDGTFRTLANGDRVKGVLRDGDVAWAATEGGGLVRWDLVTGAYRQYLAPQDGLPSNDVNEVAKAADGALWLATEGGLVRLEPDEAEVTVFTPATSPGMLSATVRALAPAADGRLWVGFGQSWDPLAVDPTTRLPGTFRPGGLARFDPVTGQWDAVAHAEPLSTSPIGGDDTERYKTIPSENITALALGSDGILWVGTEPFYVFEQAICPPSDPTCIRGGTWVLAGGGLAAHQGEAWMNWLPSEAEQSCFANHITDLAPDLQGRMWVATAGRGLLLMKNGLKRSGCRSGGQPYWVRPTRNRPGPRGNYMWAVDVADDGRVWMGLGASRDDGLGVGVLMHNETFDTTLDDSWEFLDVDGGPTETRTLVTALDVGGLGPRLLGTQDDFRGDGAGLRAYDPARRSWQPLRTADDGLPSNWITGVAVHPATGDVWFAFAHRGVARWGADGWRWWRAFDKGRSVARTTLDVAAGLGRVPVDMPDQAAFDAAFPSLPRYVRFGEDPTLYRLTRSSLTTVGGVKYLDFTPKLGQALPAGAAVYNVDRGPASDAATDIAFDAGGNVWVGGNKTIWLGANCPADWGVNCWLDGGLGRFDGKVWRVYDEHTPDVNGKTLPDQPVAAVAVDRQGRVWAGTGDRGLAQGSGIGVLDPVAGTWSVHPANRQTPFAGLGIADLAVDPVSGDMWVAHHAAEDCIPGTGGACRWVRYGGGVSRWNGAAWAIWQKPAAGLVAFGTEGEMSSVLVDRGGGRVWAGGWDAREDSFHWGAGVGIHAVVNWCPLDCADGAWQSRVWPNDGEVAALELDDDGHLWAGTHRSGNGIAPPEAGLKLFDGQAWHTYTPANSGLPSQEITSLAQSSAQMWVGTRNRGASLYTRYVPPTPTATREPSATPAATVTATATADLTATATAATPTASPATATATPRAQTATATATARDTSQPRPVYALYLPFAYQPTRCRTCPTVTPRPARW